MQLFFSAASPYVRKVTVTAHEKGLSDRIEIVSAAASPVNRDQNVVAKNPSGKVPTLITDDGTALYDSRVIIAYLNSLAPEPVLIPPSGPDRFAVMTLEALCDSIMDAALLARYEEALRPEPLRWADWHKGQMDKVESGLAALNNLYLPLLKGPFNLGSITAVAALGYLGFRFAGLAWEARYPALAAWWEEIQTRPSVAATAPKG